MRRQVIAALTMLALTCVGALQWGHAGGMTAIAVNAAPVNTFTIADGNVAGLIAAINAANNEVANPGPDTIQLAASGTYTFTAPHNFEFGPNALPIIRSDITI